MWEAYLPVFQCRQHKFETNKEYFECFKNYTSVITQYDGSIRQYTGLVNHLGSKEDAQENFLAVRLVQNSDDVRYVELKVYMHNSYVNGKDSWPKTLPAALNVLFNLEVGKRPPTH